MYANINLYEFRITSHFDKTKKQKKN